MESNYCKRARTPKSDHSHSSKSKKIKSNKSTEKDKTIRDKNSNSSESDSPIRKTSFTKRRKRNIEESNSHSTMSQNKPSKKFNDIKKSTLEEKPSKEEKEEKEEIKTNSQFQDKQETPLRNLLSKLGNIEAFNSSSHSSMGKITEILIN